MKKLRIGIIGIGRIGLAQLEAVKAIERAGYAELVAISTRDEAKARSVCARFHVPAYFTDYRAMLAEADLDLVHNCTPNTAHYEINRDILASGRHVLSEKPLTVDSAQSGELVALAQERHLKTAVNFVYRHYPVVQQLRRLIAAGWFGEIYAVHGSYLQDWLASEGDYDWRVESRYCGPSRAFADIGSHWIDMAQFLLGQNVSGLTADFATFIPTRIKSMSGPDGSSIVSSSAASSSVEVDTEDYAGLLLEFERGARGGLVVSQVSAGQKSGLGIEVDGSKPRRAGQGDKELVTDRRRGVPEQRAGRGRTTLHMSAGLPGIGRKRGSSIFRSGSLEKPRPTPTSSRATALCGSSRRPSRAGDGARG
jgi:predicted dehydrogenase